MAVSALDVSIARKVTDLLLHIQESEGVSLLFISHDIAVVERVSHRIAVIYGGQTVEIRLSWSVLDAPKTPLHSAPPVGCPDPGPIATPQS